MNISIDESMTYGEIPLGNLFHLEGEIYCKYNLTGDAININTGSTMLLNQGTVVRPVREVNIKL
jgi:hypothetical protein